MENLETLEGCFVCQTPVYRASLPALLPCTHLVICDTCQLHLSGHITCSLCFKSYSQRFQPNSSLMQWQENLEVIQSLRFSESTMKYLQEEIGYFHAWRNLGIEIKPFQKAGWSGKRPVPQSHSEASVSELGTDTCDTSTEPLCRPSFHADDIHRLNRDLFGNPGLREKQMEAILAVLEGKDVFLCLPTGGGKSLCYQLPVCLTDSLMVVVMPLLSLIRDQAAAMDKLHIQNCYFSSDLPDSTLRQNYMNMENSATLRLIYLTPEHLMKSNHTKAALQKLYEAGRLTRIVVDEAHCVSKWGRSFREDYLGLKRLRELFPGIPILALTATATELVKKDVIDILHLTAPLTIQSSFNRPNLIYSVRPKSRQTNHEIANFIHQHGTESGLIYCSTKREAEKCAESLGRIYGVNIDFYHAGVEDGRRVEREKRWKAGEIQVLACTVAFGMGIDKPDVRFVVHRTIPMGLDCYAQEAGRAGRDGERAECVMYYSPSDRGKKLKLLESDWRENKFHGNDRYEETACRQLADLDTLCAYCENHCECRRVLQLDFLGEVFSPVQCHSTCDNCQSRSLITTKDLTTPAKTLISLLQDTRNTHNFPQFVYQNRHISADLATLTEEEIAYLVKLMISKHVFKYEGRPFDYYLTLDTQYSELFDGNLNFEIAVLPENRVPKLPKRPIKANKGQVRRSKEAENKPVNLLI